MDNYVILEPDDILWGIVVKKIGDDEVELSWGWDAGLTPEQLAELDAEDPNDPWPNPRGMDKIVTSLEGAEELYRDLGILLDKQEKPARIVESKPNYYDADFF